MAPPSPRRSSRARAAYPQSQQLSISSGVSGRSERNTRSLHRPSSDKSTPSASLSSEPLEDSEEGLMPRRRRRGLDDDPEKILQSDMMDGMVNASDEMQDEEDEAVRCICGSEDYPGRPPVDGPDADLFASVDLTAEDVTGFFVQCDVCKVWQHGACVGIFSAESSPDEYFCEQCRQDLHKIAVANNGQRYSKYLPLHRQSQPASRATSVIRDGAKSPKFSSKASRAEQALQASKRRSTMNSRDAAYDDELLLRAIEASRENVPQDVEPGNRRAKRGRSDSEENQASVKRQRTASRSVSPATEPVAEHSRDESDDDTSTRNGAKKNRSHRGTKVKSEKDDRERQRQEAANKRKNRAERRRAEDSDISEETHLATTKPVAPKASEASSASAPTPTVTTNAPGTPPPTSTTIGSSHKRTAKSQQKRIRGKNQYTKDREEVEESPARSESRDFQRTAEESHPKSPSSDTRQSSKIKPSAASKITMVDMKRRVAAIMEFISRTQVDLAAEAACQTNSSSGEASPQKVSMDNGDQAKGSGGLDHTAEGSITDKEFRNLACVEMMDVLTRDMVKWQNHYT
ncbi:Histone deacetylase complex subunit CTI6 [Beauveria bassiana]|nr:Histone deacetylase complex subunit CTI6 [Beauveria bassiana]KAH8711122.1 Histone deacetylase complex subunit CTI6 [Beauveria bassiana]